MIHGVFGDTHRCQKVKTNELNIGSCSASTGQCLVLKLSMLPCCLQRNGVSHVYKDDQSFILADTVGIGSGPMSSSHL